MWAAAHDNCAYFRTSAEYLDSSIDSSSLHTVQSEVTATSKTRLDYFSVETGIDKRGANFRCGATVMEQILHNRSIMQNLNFTVAITNVFKKNY